MILLKQNMKSGLAKYWSKEYELKLEFNRFGIISMCILIVSCLGGITVGLGGLNNIYHVVMLASTTMATVVLILAVCPMKWILTSSVIAILVDVLLMIVYLIQ